MSPKSKRLLNDLHSARAVSSSRHSGFRGFRTPALVLYLALCSVVIILADANNATAKTPQALKVEGDVEYTHDPFIAKDGDTWYLFGTANGPVRRGELPIRCSNDLHHWKL